MDYKKRCQDCACLIEKNGVWCCDECFGQKCEEVTDCPYGLDEKGMAEYEELCKVKVKHDAQAERPRKQSKPRTVKVSDAKKHLFSNLHTYLQDYCLNFGGNVEVSKENKLMIVEIDGKTFKIDLIEKKKKKH